MAAERDTTDRYLASYLAERVGAEFSGHISGIQRFGAFVKLDETGADGLIPVSTIGAEYYRYDEAARTLTGERSGQELSVGLPVLVRLAEAVPLTGGLMLELLEVDGKTLKTGGRGGKPGAPVSRKGAKARYKAEKADKAVRRRRK
jgi:ribonuclease R